MKIKNIQTPFKKTLPHLFGCSIVPKFKSPILGECLLYNDFRDSSTDGSAGYCHQDFQTKCTGKIQFCRNPDSLKQHLAKQGLGWEEKKSYDYRHLRGHECVSKARTFPSSIVARIDSLPKPLLITTAFIMPLLAGFLNLLRGSGISSWVIYLVPISLITWFTKRMDRIRHLFVP